MVISSLMTSPPPNFSLVSCSLILSCKITALKLSFLFLRFTLLFVQELEKFSKTIMFPWAVLCCQWCSYTDSHSNISFFSFDCGVHFYLAHPKDVSQCQEFMQVFCLYTDTDVILKLPLPGLYSYQIKSLCCYHEKVPRKTLA